MYNLESWKKRKKELKLTLEDISKTSGVGISTVKDIFWGVTTSHRIDTIQAIEQALEINDEDMIKAIGGFQIPEDKYAIPLFDTKISLFWHFFRHFL